VALQVDKSQESETSRASCRRFRPPSPALRFCVASTFLGGSFYSISMLPPIWQKLSMLNPSAYLISGFRWSFFDTSEMHVGISSSVTLVFFFVALAFAAWIMKTGWRLKA
jgi:ABC-type polysaccharide/polyol phosphate export permease